MSWTLYSLEGTGLYPGTVSAVLYLGETTSKLYESRDIPVAPGDFGVTATESPAPFAAPGDVAIANQVYQLGEHLLRLEITSKANGMVFTAYGYLEVVPLTTVQWHWTTAQGTVDTSAPSVTAPPFTLRFDFVINHGYQVLGTLANNASNRNVSFTGSIAILETPFGSDGY